MAEITAPAGLTAALDDVWTNLTADDDHMHDPAAQDVARAALGALGESWRELLSSVREHLARMPYAAIIRADQNADARSAPFLLMSLALSLGEMVNPYHERIKSTPLLQEIVAKGPNSPDYVWLWHTDSADWRIPNDYSALTCMRTALEGGATQTLSLDSLRADPQWREQELRPLTDLAFAWQIDPYLGGGTIEQMVISADRLRFRRELMKEGGPDGFDAAVREFSELADSVTPDVSALLRPGDVLIFDNRKIMHRSSQVVDPDRRRLLLRVKIMASDVPAAA